ncbi:MAG TPA: hypothetical protein VF611_00800 [Pyrinomonadaceae bacterium]
MKVLLVAGGLLVVLLVMAAVASYFVVSRYGPGLVEAGRQTFTEGAEYGSRTDNEGCLNEAAARQARVDGFTAMVRNGVFMEACLRASRPTPGFCDDVPRQMEVMKAITWQHQQCKRFGLKPEQQCGQLFQGVQRFCEESGRPGDADANANVGGTGGGAGEGVEPPPPPPAPRRPPAPAR